MVCAVFGHAELVASIHTALANPMKGRTVIGNAHGHSTLKNFDRMVVFDDG